MLAKLNVQRKLTLLLMLPFIAVFMTAIPFAVTQVNTAIAAGSTEDVAEQARLAGVLIQGLQEERLVGLAYLTNESASRSAFHKRGATTGDAAQELNESLVLPRDVKLRTAISQLASVTLTRQQVVERSIEKQTVIDTYHKHIVGFIDALKLTQQDNADSTGTRQMALLDSLLRTNEEMAQVGAGLIFASSTAADAVAAAAVVEEAQLLRASSSTRFRQQAGSEENTLLNLVEQGPTGRKTDLLASQLLATGKPLSLGETLATAHSMVALTRVQQERIARDIATRSAERASDARLYAGLIVGGAGLIIILVIGLSVAVSRSVSVPLRRLTRAARNVADIATAELVRVADSEMEDTQPPQLTAVEVQTSDEIGEMADAFNQVQMTAAKLMEQQVATRRNTAVMFANVARRTRSMVARQLTFIDDLERNEQNERLLAKLYRLDHLTTRLHRSADSLLVVSGAREDERIVSPAPLSDVVRSAVAEIEGYQNVQTGALPGVIVAPQLVPDLRLVLAELLENATAFSPPGSPVEVSASVDGPCNLVVIDHGIGMSDERLAQENRRLVERERLDVVPTSVLGLFVVGRLARRHGLTVELTRTGEQGVTATVTVPIGLFHDPTQTARPQTVEPPELEVPSAPSAATLEALSSTSALSGLQGVRPAEPVPLRKEETAPAAAEPHELAQPAVPPVAQPVAEPVAEPVASQWEALHAVPEAPQPEAPQPAEMPEPVETLAPEQPVEQPVPERRTGGRRRRDDVVAQPDRLLAPEPVVEAPQPVVEPAAPAKAELAQPPVVLPATPPAAPPAATPAAPPVTEPAPAAGPEQPAEAGAGGEGFGWFVPPPDLPTAPPVPGSVSPESVEAAQAVQRPAGPQPPAAEEQREPVQAGAPTAHRGLTRRQPGGHLPSFGFGDEDFKDSPMTRDAVAERAELEAFAVGTAQAAAARLKRAVLDLPEPKFQPIERPSGPAGEPARQQSAQPQPAQVSQPATQAGRQPAGGGEERRATGHGGLTRRTPGTHLSEYLRSAGPRQAAPARATNRDADAERSALESFLDGLARAHTGPSQANHS
ncbi:MAG: HAMP domain-containing protein [Micromonosporaceae bacterium]|nr:HAMP domain-containing protein [Micromonosporaceae bacterium]